MSPRFSPWDYNPRRNQYMQYHFLWGHGSPGVRSVQRTQRTFCWSLLRLLYWTTVPSERSLNGSKRQIGVFAMANKDGGAHRVFFIMQKYPITPRLWAIIEELEDIGDTRPFAEQWSFSAQTVCCCKQKTKSSLYWTEPWSGDNCSVGTVLQLCLFQVLWLTTFPGPSPLRPK